MRSRGAPLVFHLLPGSLNSEVEEGVGDGLKTDIKHLHFVVPGLQESDLNAFTFLFVSNGVLLFERVVVLLSKCIIIPGSIKSINRDSVKEKSDHVHNENQADTTKFEDN